MPTTSDGIGLENPSELFRNEVPMTSATWRLKNKANVTCEFLIGLLGLKNYRFDGIRLCNNYHVAFAYTQCFLH